MCNYLSFTLFIIYFYLFHIIRIILFNRIIPDNPFSHRFRIRKLSFEYFFGYAQSYFQKENYELTGISRQKSSRAILTSHVTSARPIDVFLLQTNILEIDQAIILGDYPYYFQKSFQLMNTAFRMHLRVHLKCTSKCTLDEQISPFFRAGFSIFKIRKKARLFEFYQRLNIKGMHFIHITSLMTSSVTSQSFHDDVMMRS